VHATVSLSASGSVSNTATVSVPASVTDTVPGNDSSSDTDTITAPASSADLAVTEIGPPTITPGGHLAFLVTITNNGPDAAQNVVLSGSLPAGTVLFSQSELTGPSFTLGGTSTSINDPIATLAAGASATFRIILLVSPSVPIGTILSDTVTVSASTTDAVTENDTATATVLVAAVSVPTLSPLGALGLAITLLGVGMFLIRQRF
jgi:uncharacterized repeat protein (TIGR01451 family)